jgi:hypothetical protein
MNVIVKLFIQTICSYICYTNNEQNPQTFNYTLGWGQPVTGLRLFTAPRVRPVNTKFHDSEELNFIARN